MDVHVFVFVPFLECSKDAHALGRPGQTGEVTRTIAFLASDDSFITGASVPVLGCHAMFPSSMPTSPASVPVDGGCHTMCPS